MPCAGSAQTGKVVALDILDMKPIPGVEFIKLDFLDAAAPERLKAVLGGKADVVLSDMAANATGHRQTDHLRIMALAEAAAHFAREVLAPGGSFVCKVLQGGTEAALLAELKRDFSGVKHIKPPATAATPPNFISSPAAFAGRRPEMTPLPKMPEAGWRFPHATAESRSAAWGTFCESFKRLHLHCSSD